MFKLFQTNGLHLQAEDLDKRTEEGAQWRVCLKFIQAGGTLLFLASTLLWLVVEVNITYECFVI